MIAPLSQPRQAGTHILSDSLYSIAPVLSLLAVQAAISTLAFVLPVVVAPGKALHGQPQADFHLVDDTHPPP